MLEQPQTTSRGARPCRRSQAGRAGSAAVELAIVLPLMVLLLFGLWEVGRIAEVSNVMSNAAREAARDASLAEDNLSTVANNTLSYLQAAEPTAFGQGHSTTMTPPVVSIPANATGYTCWDNTANRELFTIYFLDVSAPAVTDPTGMSKLDHFQVGVSVPYTTIRWETYSQITGVTRASVTTDWCCMRDAPFSVSPVLPAE